MEERHFLSNQEENDQEKIPKALFSRLQLNYNRIEEEEAEETLFINTINIEV